MALGEKDGAEIKEKAVEGDSEVENAQEIGRTETSKPTTENDGGDPKQNTENMDDGSDTEPAKMDEEVKPDLNTTENDAEPTDGEPTDEVEAKKEHKPDIDDWKILSSDEDDGDEDAASAAKKKKGIWEPPLDVIVKLYEELDKKGVLELNWKCPGRKDLEEERRELEKAKEVVAEAPVISEEKEEEPTEFDDFEEDTTLVKITPRRTAGSAGAQGSGRKRTAKMESILGNMIRHQKIDQEMEKGEKDTEIDPMPKSDITPRRPGKVHIRNNIDS